MNTLEFTKLPLFEVMIRIAPSDVIPIAFELEYHLYERFRDEFTGRNRVSFVANFGTGALPVEKSEMRGFELIRHWPGSLIVLVIQSNMMAIQWYRSLFKSAEEYPRYSELRALLDRLVSTLREAPGPFSDLKFRAANMRYSNYVRTKCQPTLKDVRKYVAQGFAQPGLADDLCLHGITTCWREHDGQDIRVNIDNSGGITKYGWELVTGCGQLLEPECEDVLPVVDRIHDKLNERFPTFLTASAKKQWGLQGHEKK